MSRRRRPLATALVVLGALVGSSCSIQPNATPRDVPAAQRRQFEAVDPSAGLARGLGRVFLASGSGDGTRLRAVPREDASGEPIIEALLDGPNEAELDADLRTLLPSDLDLISAGQNSSTFTIDIGDAILELTGAELRIAIAQLVFTASEIDGVLGVVILVDGQRREWPNGSGELRSTPLGVYDFPGLAETSQPRYPPVPSPQPDAAADG